MQNSQQLVKTFLFILKTSLIFAVFEVWYLEFGDSFDYIIFLAFVKIVRFPGWWHWQTSYIAVIASTNVYYLKSCAMPVTSHMLLIWSNISELYTVTDCCW